MSGWLTSGRSTRRSTATASASMISTHEDQSQEGRHAGRVQADQREGGEHHHDALGEVEHAGGLEDQDEPERDQRVEDARDEPFPQHLEEEVRACRHLDERVDEDGVEDPSALR